MKSATARRMMEACRAKANEVGKPVSVAILDAAARVVMVENMSDARPYTSMTAEGKARASVLTGRDSALTAEWALERPIIVRTIENRTYGPFTPHQGAVVIMDANDEVAGAIGVSGATSEEDEDIARAGAAVYAG